jgi:hypothetical protein
LESEGRVDKIRVATEEEIKEIAAESNLTPMSKVLAMGKMRAVWKVCHELDPVFFYDAPNTLKYKFLWGLDNILRGAGLTEWFCNVRADDTEYHKVLEHLGGERQSKQPDYRYKFNL